MLLIEMTVQFSREAHITPSSLMINFSHPVVCPVTICVHCEYIRANEPCRSKERSTGLYIQEPVIMYACMCARK